jgi:hypothetical protein
MFPVKHDGGTTRERDMATQFHFGFLVGEGHFGGAGHQPHVTLRIHERHEAIFDWLQRTFPGGRVYRPYHHGGRDYLQWMARAFLREKLVSVLDRVSVTRPRPVQLRPPSANEAALSATGRGTRRTRVAAGPAATD